MMPVFWYGFARGGIIVSFAFIIFDLATGRLLGVVFQMVMLLGYLLIAIATARPFREYQRQQRRRELDLKLEGDLLEQQIAELERELNIGDLP
jgi:membrane protein implicated in regulation of membrane protease activity